ncbi:MAG: fumarylacetoacetate hydrolase family protein [Candidatus Bathyarchaeia archaeon]
MKLVVFDSKKLGAVLGGGEIVDLNLAYATYLSRRGVNRPYAHAHATLPPTLQSFLEEGGRATAAAQEAVGYVEENLEKGVSGPRGEKVVFKPDEVRVRAPLPSLGSRIACAGANFYDHAAGAASMRGVRVTVEDIRRDVEEGRHVPWGFWKFAHNVAGPEEEVVYPARTQRLDYEVEVAAVFGRAGKDIPEEVAMNYIAGYTILNDFSLRDRQEQRGSFAFGKNFDTSVGLGPCIVLKDEVPDPYVLRMELKVNDEVRQKGSMRDMIRKFPFWVSYLTRDLTFYPGDMIASGTCAGTAMDTTPRDAEGRTSPERFLKPGDVVEAKVEKIGTLKNYIVQKP